MLKVKKGLYDVLRGKFLTDEDSFKNWRILVFIVVLLLIVISSSHSLDAKVVKISVLNKKKSELRAEDFDTSTELTKMRLESSIRAKVKDKGLFPARKPPQKIKVTTKKQ
ncbi:FtsL-like putative cell division protein [Tenacibaculum piscium]|uniref:S-adenosyl-methyltransferase n=2 Tax=Tenacibaculum piscium TaxID=1458515 RepID=A0A2H1YJ03_9FLAO|nr:FtsL-like putative cell division protein [Tenacibaculum piscium]MBE7628686.1 S-adenosyl-methyltransferase [Tenacibaculum piscium]MBE7669827.1 S-adenosyl-methyltransferase [Tenacibaculum piscium]MBE7684578.1 S-adenosyl-methyltransferase [Tenacibaculum piscium]MBE7689198.1 S-adenosyl-methyltransferase [Tenacibaculum piscium]SOS75475.1 S-adenosyl-methyltransferase [Tenacibaculum piscium]